MSSSLTAERFRRLARSSPWRWQSLEFHWSTHRDARRRAWIRRPGDLRVEDADGRLVQVSSESKPPQGARAYLTSGYGRAPIPVRWPSQVEPVYADDGLVAAVPDAIDIDYDRPFFESYHWVAMLNPIELADRVHDRDAAESAPVELRDLTVVEHHGRPAWQATAQPTAAYDPRCSCCPLLSGEFDDEHDVWAPGPPSLVRLDEQTGVCVRIECNEDVALDVEIVGVDLRLDNDLFARRRRRFFRR
ncbi:hypothetical protein [Rhodococcus spongiicola]|uniref:Uncharacterized protein n=1 Tax=Rhodococcus spongiicola TaxID=2487352 RepID=A0A3S3E6Q3_9NOCA|nr:hypothetical protein [Rhodococcus spongiicola]RVW06618.1 hypothetical protein EF834_04255 [Rhodococcus spongiicola]